MTKRGMMTLTGVLLTVGCLTSSARAQETVRYINMQKVFRNYYKTAQSEASFKKQQELYKEHAEQMADQLKKLKERLDKLEDRALNVALSDEARAQSQKEARQTGELLDTKQQELREFLGEKQQELRKQEVDLRNTLTGEIVDYVQRYADDNKIDTVMDVSGMSHNLLPVIICHPEDKEITDAILAGLNAGHEDEVPAAAAEGEADGS